MKEIKVEVQFTEGYQERFTRACVEQLKKREAADEHKRP